MIKVINTLWGLLVDDGRLASILIVALILAGVSSLVGKLTIIGAVLIWLGLILSLIISIEHQLKLKTKTLRIRKD